jgi:hypothetical protein
VRRLATLAVLAACGGGSARDLRVVSWSPDGAIDRAEPVEIRFDRAVVPEALVGAPAAVTSVVFSPPIAWRGTWHDRQTLVVEPLSPLAASTRYRVTLAGELRARAGALAFSFVHQPLVVDGIWGADPAALAPDGDVPLSFDQPVLPEEAASHCVLVGAEGNIALSAMSHVAACDIRLHPLHTLAPGAAYTLACTDLGGAGGNAPLEQPYTLAVRARPALAIASVEPRGVAVQPDGARLAIAFTTPVALEAVRDSITATPAIPGLDRGTLSADGTTYTVGAELASETDYRIEITGLVDRFGQQLAPAAARFHTAAAPARLVAPTGWHAIDALSVWTRDVGAFDAACVPLGKERALAIAAGGTLDGPLPATAIDHHATIADHRWHETRVTCGAPGAYLVELRAPGVEPRRVAIDASDLAVHVVEGTNAGVAWVTSRATGRAVAGARVTVTTPQGKLVWSDLANERGLVKLPGRGAQSWLVTAELGSELAIATATGATATAAAPATRASAFPLALHAGQQAARPGERLAFELVARTPAGAPLSSARVEWTLHRRRRAVQIASLSDFAFASDATGGDVTVAEGTGATDDRGELAIAARDGAPLADGPVDYVMIATATDAIGATATATGTVIAEPAPIYLGLRTDAIAGAGTPFDVALVAATPDGTPVAAGIHLAAWRVERSCDTIATPGGELARCDEHRHPLFERELDVPAGAAREERVELDPGYYELVASAPGAVATTRTLWIPGAGASIEDDGTLAVVSGRASYRPGATARIAAISGGAHATALVVIERAGVLDARVIDLASAGDPIELAVADAWAPGVHAQVALASPGRFATGALELPVAGL